MIRRVDPFASGALGSILSYRVHRWHEMHFFGPLVGYGSEGPKVLDLYSKTAGRVPGAHGKDSVEMLAKMRMIKERREIERITKATETAAAGHLNARGAVGPRL